MGKNKEKDCKQEPVNKEEELGTEPILEPEIVEETSAAPETEEKVKELENQLLRQMAEFDNYRKRTTKEKEEIGLTARAKCISDLLPVVDNFERAIQSDCTDEEFKKGVKMIFDSLMLTLQKQGVAEIEAEGAPFDPEVHYAVSRVEDDSLGENVIANVMQKGYKIGDKVIRHAMVAVANP